MIYVVCGPTGSGKTSLALKLAHKLNCKIINADAFQIYKDMNIGTAKVSNKEEYNLHYLLDIVTPEQTYSIKEYQKDFRLCLSNLKEDNVVVVGGSGLYIKSALYDYDFPEYSDDVSDLEKLSSDELRKMLEELDPESLKNIHENNRKRIIHAISMARTGNIKSEVIAKQEHKLIYDNVRFIFISPDRKTLYENINKRVDVMINNGLVDEVKTLLNKYNLSTTSKEAIGYKEIISYLNGEISLEESIALIKQRSRNYAKRQVTYFKHQLPCEEYESVEAAERNLLWDRYL